MNKRLFILFFTSCMLWLVSCQKENIITAKSNLISSQSSTADAAAARQKVYVKAIRPYSDSVIGGDVFPVTVVLNKPAPAGGSNCKIYASRNITVELSGSGCRVKVHKYKKY